jgi:FHS family L-fucose permease-like MFS transporter
MKSPKMFTKNGINYLFPFILVTSLFALWGFANDITNPMVAAFRDILLISNFQSSLVQFAFYGGYCLMAIPAAIFIKRFNYKNGILVGLVLYSLGCLLFIPAGNATAFWAFLMAYFVMTCGLAFLETTANPFILSMGPEESATRRLNFSQAFNPIGSLTGMLIAKNFILAKLYRASEEVFGEYSEETENVARAFLQENNPERFAEIQRFDLDVVSGPYLMLGLVVLAFLLVFAIVKFPGASAIEKGPLHIGATFRRLFENALYKRAVVAQAFYVGAQIMVWTFVIQYAGAELGMSKADAQGFNMIAMGIFVSSRFICTYLLKYIKPSFLLTCLALGATFFTLGAIFVQGMFGLYSLMAISACMSLMFPTIYGIALKDLGDDAKLGSAGLILAIGGGCLMPPLQGLLIDKAVWFEALSSVRISFVLPLTCFVVIAYFGYWAARRVRVKA